MKCKLLLLVAVVGLASGCANYHHDRYDPATGMRIEGTGFRNFMMRGEAGKITSYVKDGTYTRRVNVSEIEGSGDANMFKAIFDAGVEAGKKGAGVP